ncbi:PadR family transcriptional regulator [Acidianus sp. HS-5]|uniref:PadR family transcriptional regulator n=1 Tax=Acidianus sp. HS-5 TaxID=2886040 RepID=UPI001F3C252F|nr:PadR family transcriptional regulator [Acidianus sp. HS-5]
MMSYQKGRLKFMVLWLLSESPKRGIDIIDDISKMTWGWWKPSPGSIYPLLSTLEKEGKIIRKDNGIYEITQKGIEEINDFLPPRYEGSLERGVEELESLVVFFEDMGKDKLIPYRDRLIKAKNRLERLIE